MDARRAALASAPVSGDSLPMPSPASNVVALRPRAAADLARAGLATASVADELVALARQLREAGGNVATLERPSLEVERAVQLVLDAVTAVERALDVVTGDGERFPF